MRLLTAHKILISTAVVFFIYFAFWELRRYSGGNDWAGLRAILYFMVALGFGIYLKHLKRLFK